jgi:hypothetical protein
MKKVRYFIIFSILMNLQLASFESYGQQWTGSSDATGNLQRTGNVGIGTNASPVYKAVVQGEIHINRDYPYLQLNSSYWNGASFIQNGVTTAGSGGGNYMLFYNMAVKDSTSTSRVTT